MRARLPALRAAVVYRRTIPIGFFLFLLGAAPASWPMYQYFPNHNAVFASSQPPHSWRFDARGKINGGLAVVGDRLYADTFAPAVIALDRTDGKVIWRTRMPNTTMTTPIVADGLVIVGTGKDHVAVDRGQTLIWGVPGGDEIAALDAKNGHVVWTYKTVGEDMPSPALVRIGGRDAIVFANGDDHVRALDVQTGHLIWSTPLLGVSTMSSAAALNGVVYVLAGVAASMHLPDHVYAVSASDGRILWAAPYGNADDSPVVGDGHVIVEDAQTFPGPADADASNDVYALDAGSGRLIWGRRSSPGYFTRIGTNEEAIAALIQGGVVFQSFLAARRLVALDLRTGHPIWSVSTQAPVKMSPVASAGRLYFGDTAGYLYVVAEGNGRLLSRRSFGKPFTCSSPVIVGSTLYIANDDRIFALPIQ
jgi:outer membrane protein assembly factor BamB